MYKVFGYLVKNGSYENKFCFEGSHKKMAAFIMMHPKDNVIITDGADSLLISANRTFIDQCRLRDKVEFLTLMQKYQFQELNFKPIKFKNVDGYMMES